MTQEERDELIEFLERDQLVTDKRTRAVPPARLTRAAQGGLWALRIFAVVVSVLVVYTFLASLH